MNQKEFKILSARDKALLRPNRILGDISTSNHKMFIVDNDKTVKHDEISYNPGLNKIIEEIIDNCVDEHIESKRKMTIKINISEDGEITISDNGRGIPNEYVDDIDGNKILIAEAAFTVINAGRNFDDEQASTNSGQNGEGAKGTNIYSKKFYVESTSIKNNKTKTCYINCNDNMANINVEVKDSKKRTGTKIIFTPDYERFGEKNLPIGNINSLMFRLFNILLVHPDLKIVYNGKQINIHSFKDYMKYITDNVLDNYIEIKGLKIAVLPNSEDSFKYIHYINTLSVINGGKPLDWVSDNIVNRLYNKLSKKYKTITRGDIKSKLFMVVIFNDMDKPRFGDQIKSVCTNTYSDFKSQIDIPDWDSFCNKLLKNKELINPIIDIFKIKEMYEQKKALKALDKPKKGKPKSEKFMSPIGKWTNIYIAEGDSAAASISKILTRNNNGFYAMFGVPPNAYDMKIAEFSKSKKLIDLKNILNLSFSKDTQDDLNFKNIIITTDFDLAGHFITGQLLGLFYRFGKHLFDEGRIKRLVTPLIIVKDNKDNIVSWFYDFDKYNEFETKNKHKKYIYEYKKGLGSWDVDELVYIIEQDGLNNMLEVYQLDNETKLYINNWLNKENADIRKEMLNGYSFNIMSE